MLMASADRWRWLAPATDVESVSVASRLVAETTPGCRFPARLHWNIAIHLRDALSRRRYSVSTGMSASERRSGNQFIGPRSGRAERRDTHSACTRLRTVSDSALMNSKHGRRPLAHHRAVQNPSPLEASTVRQLRAAERSDDRGRSCPLPSSARTNAAPRYRADRLAR